MPRACTESRNTNRQKTGSPPAYPRPRPHIQSPVPLLISSLAPFTHTSVKAEWVKGADHLLPTGVPWFVLMGKLRKKLSPAATSQMSLGERMSGLRLPWGHLHTTCTASFSFTMGPKYRPLSSKQRSALLSTVPVSLSLWH